MKNISWIILTLALMLPGQSVWALSSDRDQALQIEADQASLDDAKGETIYTGNVVIIQGTLKLSAEKVTLTYDDARQIDVVIAESIGDKVKPVYFEQVLDTKEKVHAEARLMEYHAKKDMLHLKTDAKIWKNKDKVTGEHIIYNAKEGKITASSTPNKGRVKITIEPPK